ncbi:MAG: hypothetical protein Q4F40_06600 [Akkermansia sp.]|nr:hypothetical protein [Akkermansia sp.]
MTQRRQSPAPHTPPPTTGKKEFGDWRVDSAAKPVETQPMNMWQHAHRRLNQLENATSYGALWRHSVSVTYSPEQTANDDYNETYSDIVPIYGTKRIIRLLIAVFLLLPLSITMVYALALQIYHALPTTAANVGFWLSEPIYFSLLGIFTFVALIIAQFATPILVYFYVLGHELTHALAALTCFGKISSVCVDLEGGYIETDKDNTYIALAPYFVPLWMLVWVLFAWIAGFFLPEESITPWFFGGGGFWWCFHIYWTIWVIPREQPDILENGITFSLLIVIIANIAGLILLLRFFNFISLSGYWQDFLTCAGKLGETISWLFSLCVG